MRTDQSSNRRAGRPRAAAKRELILEGALHLFAEFGFHAARMDDLVANLCVARGSIFHHFSNKQGLFLEVYKHAARSLPAYMDAPKEVRDRGFFEILRYWLVRTDHLVREDWLPFRICLLGNYGTDLTVKREVNRFLAAEDPNGTLAFVKFGWERGELRRDLDADLLASVLDGMVERYQDALVVEELDPGLFRRGRVSEEQKKKELSQFLNILQRAIGVASRS